MAIRIGDCFLYKGKYYLDSRQNLPKTKEDLLNWNIPVPEGFEVFVDGDWYIYQETNNDVVTGKFNKRLSKDALEDILLEIENLSLYLVEIQNKLNSRYTTSTKLIDQNLTIELNTRITNLINLNLDNSISINSNLTTTIAELENIKSENQVTITSHLDNLSSTLTLKNENLNTQLASIISDLNLEINSLSSQITTKIAELNNRLDPLSVRITDLDNLYKVKFVDLVDDLTEESTWMRDGKSYIKKGMLVSVINDIESNNGIYRLKEDDISSIDNWIKLSENEIAIITSTSTAEFTDDTIMSALRMSEDFTNKTIPQTINFDWVFKDTLTSRDTFIQQNALGEFNIELDVVNDNLKFNSNNWATIDNPHLEIGDVYLDTVTNNLMVYPPVDDELVYINISSNQGNNDAISNLTGVVISISYDDIVNDFVWEGNEIVATVPNNKNYTLSFSNVTGYLVPDSLTYTSSFGGTRFITATYSCEVAIISIVTNDGVSTSTDYIQIFIGGSSIPTYTFYGPNILAKIPTNSSYRIKTSNKTDYITPEDLIFNATLRQRNITIRYTKGIYETITYNHAPLSIYKDNSGVLDSLLSRIKRCLVKSINNGVKICYLDDNNSNLYYDGTTTSNLEGTEGDVMVYFPEYYYKYTKISDNEFTYQVSTEYIDDTYQHVSECLIGAYKGHILDNKLRSISGVTPTTGLNYLTYKEAAENKDEFTKFQMIDHAMHRSLVFLLFAKYENTQLLPYLGVSSASYLNKTGETNTLGNNDTTSSTIVLWSNGLGIEGILGGLGEFMEGILITDEKDWILTLDNGSKEIITSNNSTGVRQITNVIFSDKFYCIPTELPDERATSGNFNSFYNIPSSSISSDSLVLCRTLASSQDILASITFEIGSSSSPTIGTRLAYRGDITIEDDVDLFKSL